MLKHNLKNWSRLSGLVPFILIIFSFFGCKSLSSVNPVDSLDLLDSKSSFYLAIPGGVDQELIENILKGNVETLTDQDAKLIAERIDVIYCGLTNHKNSTDIQAAVKAHIPQSYFPKVFSKKNGWNSETFTPNNSDSKYNIYSSSDINLAAPGSDIICLGRDIEYMLENYNEISEDVKIKPKYSELPDEIYNYLHNAENEIRFYANRPQSFLTVLTGANLDLKLIDVYGNFVCDPKRKNQYILELDFRFRNEKFLKAGKTLLSMVFGLANGETMSDEDNVLKVKNIKLKKEQLLKILVIKK